MLKTTNKYIPIPPYSFTVKRETPINFLTILSINNIAINITIAAMDISLSICLILFSDLENEFTMITPFTNFSEKVKTFGNHAIPC